MFIDDPTGTLTAQDRTQLENATSKFDVKIIVANTPSRAELDGSVGRLVNSANTLAIGVDPVHRYTFTHFGTGTRIRSDDFATVAHAGNSAFKAGHWGDGLLAIVQTASASVRETPAQVIAVNHQTVVEKPVPVLPFVIGFGAFALLGALLWRWSRQQKREFESVTSGFRDEAAEMRARNVEAKAWEDKFREKASGPAFPIPADPIATPAKPPQAAASRPYPIPRAPSASPPPSFQRRVIHPAPAPVHIHHHHSSGGGSGDLLTGVVIGEAIARRDPPPPAPAPSRSSWRDDTPARSSSSSSSWGSDSSSSFDSGSSGGSFDSGGGFDGGSSGGDF